MLWSHKCHPLILIPLIHVIHLSLSNFTNSKRTRIFSVPAIYVGFIVAIFPLSIPRSSKRTSHPLLRFERCPRPEAIDKSTTILRISFDRSVLLSLADLNNGKEMTTQQCVVLRLDEGGKGCRGAFTL